MLSNIFSKSEKKSLPWRHLAVKSDLDQVDSVSAQKPVMIFKHSTRCSISAMALSRFEREFDNSAGFEPYFLDLIANREISNEIAVRYNVRHESPQAILIKDGKAVFDSSHMGIDFSEINQIANSN